MATAILVSRAGAALASCALFVSGCTRNVGRFVPDRETGAVDDGEAGSAPDAAADSCGPGIALDVADPGFEQSPSLASLGWAGFHADIDRVESINPHAGRWLLRIRVRDDAFDGGSNPNREFGANRVVALDPDAGSPRAVSFTFHARAPASAASIRLLSAGISFRHVDAAAGTVAVCPPLTETFNGPPRAAMTPPSSAWEARTFRYELASDGGARLRIADLARCRFQVHVAAEAVDNAAVLDVDDIEVCYEP